MKRSNIIEAIEHESKTSIYAQLLPSTSVHTKEPSINYVVSKLATLDAFFNKESI